MLIFVLYFPVEFSTPLLSRLMPNFRKRNKTYGNVQYYFCSDQKIILQKKLNSILLFIIVWPKDQVLPIRWTDFGMIHGIFSLETIGFIKWILIEILFNTHIIRGRQLVKVFILDDGQLMIQECNYMAQKV